MKSGWVRWEINKSRERDPTDQTLLPLKFEAIDLPDDLARLYWVDFQDPANDEAKAREVAGLVRSADARLGRQRRGFRGPAGKDEVGAFPPAPIYKFQGRAHELHELERQFRVHRAILLHAMGGMGKTALATEAAHWWTRSGLFRDGACFISFEQFASAERVEQILGTYLEGPNFESLPAAEQRRRAIELFNEKDVLMVWDNFESVLPQFNEEAWQRARHSVDEKAATENHAKDATTEPASDAALAQAGPYTPDERARLFDLFRDLTAASTGSPPGRGRLLITCRPGETGLQGVFRTELKGLARADSLWLLSRVIAKDGLTLNDPRLVKERLNPLLDALADHPLSIELVGPHLKKLTPEAIITDFAKLVVQFRRGAGLERNESLLASLAFSTRRLSTAAQAALPWLAMFSGGVFEQILLDVSELDPKQWESARAELEATALIRVEDKVLLANRPYLRFHPTLTYAASGEATVDSESPVERFAEVYFAVMRTVDQALIGSNARWGLELMSREEANFRTAVLWVMAHQRYATASHMGATFRDYLERSGRLRERNAWVAWLAGEVRKGGFSEAFASRERDEAWSRFTQGFAKEAISRLEDLIERLRVATGFDPAFQLATSQLMLGRILHISNLSGKAIQVLEENVRQWEVLVDRAASGEAGEAERSNHSTALGDLANALRSAGRHDAALAAAKRAIAIDRDLGHDRDLAAGLIQYARILLEQGRYSEADAQYDEALTAVRQAGDKELEGALLQHQGRLATELRQYGRSGTLYQRALKLFQEMNDSEGVLQTCNLLGEIERAQGRLREARTWYERSREIALRLENIKGMYQATHNISVVCQSEGDTLKQQGRDAEARQRYEEAKQFMTECLQLGQQRSNEPDTATSLAQLARVQLRLGELDAAERGARQCLEIDERLGLIPELPRDYDLLAAIARARGHTNQAAEWEHKRDMAQKESRRRASGQAAELP